MTTSAFEQAVKTVRFLAVDAVEAAKSGHPGTPMALAGIAVELYTRHLRWVPEAPQWPNRDRFVLSCGHASMLQYAILHLAGYDVSLDDLRAFRQWGSRTPGHPEVGHTPGVETTTGPLGQGLGNAVGLALASKMMAARVNTPEHPLVDYRVFALVSDGDVMEGVGSEAASLAGHLGLDNLVVVYDDNRITIDGSTELSFSEDVGKRFQAHGFDVWHVDGHDPASVRATLDQVVAAVGRPKLVVARTRIGFGAPTKEGSAKAHGAPLGAEEVLGAKQRAGWPTEPFHVPEEARELFRARAAENREVMRRWQGALDAAPEASRIAFDRHLEQRVPLGLLEEFVDACPAGPGATRSLASEVQQRAASLFPALVGGSADLAESCKTTILEGGHVSARDFSGRNLHFGVRELGMGAVLNGLSLSGFFLPYGSTFLVFSDYLRPALRLSALMRRQVVYVFTHDSIHVGEDGPTHQPVEHIAALRLIPGLHVVRPADAWECAAAWCHALTRRDGPTALILSRQTLPELRRPEEFDLHQLTRGAYVLEETTQARATVIASGSEVGVVVEAAARLRAEGIPLRVVSAPCWEVFEERPADERAAVLGELPRAVVEAGVTAPWRHVVGEGGLVVGVDRFGASAPGARVAAELGLDAAGVARRLRSWLAQRA